MAFQLGLLLNRGLGQLAKGLFRMHLKILVRKYILFELTKDQLIFCLSFILPF